MNLLSEMEVACPYCGETISIMIDESVAEQSYIEDCQVCCRPISFMVTTYPGEEASVEVRREDD
ncbi:MAG: CPXCG motif-containing cysteine-rich protein [Xanthomonadales bacterium]|nr:CPXCG motif-containing cysteine-rich protein [Xanthomonadales bacterium]